ncbi:hypothetical protein ACVMAJ_000297 [Bradyrhizobium sp. USDA 4448]
MVTSPALADNDLAPAGLDRMPRQDRRIVAALRRDEAVGEPRHDVLRSRLIEIGRNALAHVENDGAQIVHAMGLVRMLMGQEHRVDVVDIGIDELLAQIRRGIDHNARGAVA